MKILSKRIYEGKNIYSYKKCIRIDVDLCGYSNIPSKEIDGFNEKLLKIIPELYRHRCGIDEDMGFVKRLNEGTYLAHITEHIIIAIHNKLGIDICYGKSREIEGEKYYIVFEYKYKSTAIEVSKLAVDIVNSLIDNQYINYNNRINILKEILRNELVGPSTKSIIEAAKRYGIPSFELGNSGFYQLGYGKQGRVIEATIGANTSCVAADIASDKVISKELLQSQNIPVSRGSKVCNIINLLKSADEIGYPLVLKPRYGSKGRGVILNIKNEKELVKEYNILNKKYSELILEEYVEGNDYRICIVDYNVIAVSMRNPPHIIGDGTHNVKYLIMKLNKNPNRGFDHEKPLTKIKIDNELLLNLRKCGKSLAYIPTKGEKIILRQNANLSTGGIAVDCTNEICKENIELFIRAAKIIGLDICGIDVKAQDISKPLQNQGVVVEVNAAPGIRMHEYPSKGKSIDVGDSIVKLQYGGVPSNIPVISITGTNGKTTTTRLISHILTLCGYKVGMTSTDGIYIDGKCIQSGDDTGYYSAKTVLLNKEVEVAVLETARGGIIRNGLAYDLADVAVLTNITEDHIGLNGVKNIDDLCFVKSLVLEAVKDDGFSVINADDEYSRKIISRIKSKKVLFSTNSDNDLIKNISNDDIAVYIWNDNIVVNEYGKIRKIININNIPITFNGVLKFNIENCLAAISALIALDISYIQIIKGLKTFKLNSKNNLGRFNMHNVDGVNVIFDYGHNMQGYKCVLESLQKIKERKIIGVIGVPGDRRNSTIISIGSMCEKVMDKIIIKEDKDKRGRKEGEVAKILQKSIMDLRPINKPIICLDEVDAFKIALDIAQKDDIVIVFYEELKGITDLLKEYKNQNYTEKLNRATS